MMFHGKTLAIATMHGKESVIAPMLREAFGMTVSVAEKMNTDVFGTFTGERKRPADQLRTCILKAKAALETCEADYAIASEGSFGSHPSCLFLPMNLEVVVLVDKAGVHTVIGESSTTKVHALSQYVTSTDEALQFARKHDFPRHGIIVRKYEGHVRSMRKDVDNEEALERSVADILRSPFNSKAFLETDLRAHRNPTRMQNIHAATANLIENMQRACPQCGKPGFRLVCKKKGLPCSWCARPTDVPAHDVYGCFHCGHEESHKRSDGKAMADPGECVYCNP